MIETNPHNQSNKPAGREPNEFSSVELTIEKLVYGGSGLARIAGQVFLVPYVLPGERVRVRPVRHRAGLVEAELLEILEPSEHRVEPQCPYFYRCGGCQYQHISYRSQVELKRQILVETLERIGKVKVDVPVEVVSGQPWQYRNRTQFQVAGRKIGFFEAGSRNLCPVTFCPISAPLINQALLELLKLARSPKFPTFIQRIEFFTNDEVVLMNATSRPGAGGLARWFFEWCAKKIPGAQLGELLYPAAGFTFRVSHNSFFQVNRYLVDKFAETITGLVEGSHGVELYAGVGLLTLPLTKRGIKLTAVEASLSAYRDLVHNLETVGLEVTPIRASAASYLAELREQPEFVLADPPRAGMGKEVVQELLRLTPKQIVIVGCDPATMARDLQLLVVGGHYQLARITFIDMFPHTYHIEAALDLRLKG